MEFFPPSFNLFTYTPLYTLAHPNLQIMDGMVKKSGVTHLGDSVSLCDLGYCDVGLDDNWQVGGVAHPVRKPSSRLSSSSLFSFYILILLYNFYFKSSIQS